MNYLDRVQPSCKAALTVFPYSDIPFIVNIHSSEGVTNNTSSSNYSAHCLEQNTKDVLHQNQQITIYLRVQRQDNKADKNNKQINLNKPIIAN